MVCQASRLPFASGARQTTSRRELAGDGRALLATSASGVARARGKQDACAPGLLRLRVRLVVNFHQSIRGNVRILLRGRKPDVSQQFLNGTQIGSGIQQVRGE